MNKLKYGEKRRSDIHAWSEQFKSILKAEIIFSSTKSTREKKALTWSHSFLA